MTTVFERLQKVLDLERRLGYRNRAVIGGMAGFAERWEEDVLAAGADAQQEALIKEIVALLSGYSEVEDHAARRLVVEDVLGKAGQAAQQAADAPSPPATERPTLPQPPELERPKEGRAKPPRPLVRSGDEEVKPARPPKRPARRPSPPPGPEPTGLEAPVTRLPGVGPHKAERLERLGVRSIGDLLYLFPRRYDDYSRLKTIDRLEYGEEVTIIGNVWDIQSRKGRRRSITIVTAIVGDATGTIQVTWFNPYITRQLRPGRTVVLSGKVNERLGRSSVAK